MHRVEQDDAPPPRWVLRAPHAADPRHGPSASRCDHRDRGALPAGAVDFARLATTADARIDCIASGPGVMTRADCVTDLTVTALAEVRCGWPEAAFEVTARVAAARRCPAGRQTAVAPRALPRAAIVCLRRAEC